jgi:hypothetical protein
MEAEDADGLGLTPVDRRKLLEMIAGAKVRMRGCSGDATGGQRRDSERSPRGRVRAPLGLAKGPALASSERAAG